MPEADDAAILAALPVRYVADDFPWLGEGGMGRVLRVRDVVLGVPVAIKLVRPDLASDERFRRLFELEVRISARFCHPNVVPIHDHGLLADGTPYLGLAFADAGSFALYRGLPPEWPVLLRLMRELLDALAHLHARGVLHRDLKPENVLLWRDPDAEVHVWLADLGLANAADDLARRKGRTEGTPGYMSPEQRRGAPREYGSWTDIFSLAVMLWEVTTGSRPFPDEWVDLPDLPPFVPRMAVPTRLGHLLGLALAAEPLSRFDLAADFRAELGRLGPPVRMRAPPPSAPAPGAEVQGTVYGFDPDALARFAVPSWNRPPPDPLPEAWPAPVGLGGRARASLPLFALRELPLVAREPWIQQLWEEATKTATTKRPRAVIVVGEAGSGKTHIVETFVRTLEEGGWGESVHLRYEQPAGPDDGYAGAARGLIRPWNESADSLRGRLARRLARERGARDLAVEGEATALVRWAGLGEDRVEVPAGYGLREVYRHLDARLWRCVSCLVIDDAQWAVEEGDGLAIAEAVLQSTDGEAERPLLVVALVREEALAADKRLAARVDALTGLGASRIDVPRLDLAGTRRLLAEALALTPELADRVATRCEGNPLFARQVLVEWSSRGWLVDSGGLVFDLAPGVEADAVLPADAATLLLARLESLAVASGEPEALRDAAHLAALAGRSLPAELVDELLSPSISAFARGCGLWVPDGTGLQFDGALLHQALRAQAESREDIARLHLRLVEAWAAVGSRTGVRADLAIGRHAAAGGAWERAREALFLAAAQAAHAGRAQELEAAAQLAAEVCHRLGDRVGAARAALAHGQALDAAGRAAEASQRYAIAKIGLEGSDAEAGVRATLGLGRAALQRGELGEALRWTGEALVKARAIHAPLLEARAGLAQGWVEQERRNFDGAELLFARAGNRFAREGDARGVAEAALGQAIVARRRGEFDEALGLITESLQASQEVDDPIGRLRALLARAEVHRLRGDAAAAEADLSLAADGAESLGSTALTLHARLLQADLSRRRGDEDKARRGYEIVSRQAERLGLVDLAVSACLGEARLATASDDAAAAHAAANRAHALLSRVPSHWLWAGYRLIVARLVASGSDEKLAFQWLWSASELGLADTVDDDAAADLLAIARMTRERGWGSVARVAAKLAVDQLERLGQGTLAAEVSGWVGPG